MMQEKAEIDPALTSASAALARTADALSCVEARLRLVEDAVSHVVGHLKSLGATDIYEFQELALRAAADAINLDALRQKVLGGAAVLVSEAESEGELDLF
jgi:hypothetical protein